MADVATTKTLYAEVPLDLHKRARIRAIEEGRSISALVEDAMERYLADAKKKAS